MLQRKCLACGIHGCGIRSSVHAGVCLLLHSTWRGGRVKRSVGSILNIITSNNLPALGFHPIHSFLPTIFSARFPSTPSEPRLLSLQPDCSNKSSLSPLPCRLFPFAVSLFLAPCSSPQSSNENHILGLMRVMGCEVGVCCLCDSSCDAWTDCGK